MKADPQSLDLIKELKELFKSLFPGLQPAEANVQITNIATTIAHSLENELPKDLDIKKYVKTNEDVFKNAALFVAENGKDPNFSPNLNNHLKAILAPTFPENKNKLRPELQLAKKELLVLLLIKFKKTHPNQKPEPEPINVNELSNEQIDNSLIYMVNLMGGMANHSNIPPLRGVTNINAIPLLSNHPAFLSPIEDELRQNPEYVEKADSSVRLASEELSASEIQQDNIQNVKKKVVQVEEEKVWSPLLDSIRKGPRPGYKKDENTD